MRWRSTFSRRHVREGRVVLGSFLTVRAGALWLGAGLALLTTLTGMGLLGLSGWFIAATAAAGMQPAGVLAFDVFMPSAGIRLLALGRTFSRYGERLVTHDATLDVAAVLRERLFRGWARPEAAHRLLGRPSRLLFRLTADIDALESLYLRVLVPALAALSAALVAGLAFGRVQGWAGLLVLAGLLSTGLGVMAVVAREARHASMRRGMALESLRARAIDLVAGQSELVMAQRVTAQDDLLRAADARLAQAERQLNALEARAGLALGFVGSAVLAGTLGWAGVLVSRGAIDVPAAVFLLLIALTVTEPFTALRRGALEAGRAWLAVRRVAPPLTEAGTAQAGPRPLPEAGQCVEMQGAVLAYPASRWVAVPCMDLRIGCGERVVLIGPSGAGKSTVLAAMAGELASRAGVVHALPACWLVQRSELFQDSVRDNLRLADPSASDARLWDVLEAAGLAASIRALVQGLDTRLGEGGLGLSAGQARRLALARLLLRDVPLWLLDEATEGLDRATACDVWVRLAHQAQGRTLVIATHLRREAEGADRLMRLEGGSLVEEARRGTPRFEALLRTLRPD